MIIKEPWEKGVTEGKLDKSYETQKRKGKRKKKDVTLLFYECQLSREESKMKEKKVMCTILGKKNNNNKKEIKVGKKVIYVMSSFFVVR